VTFPRLLDLPLPRIRLEGGAVVTHHVGRIWWWGPERDLAALSAFAVVSGPASGVARRTAPPPEPAGFPGFDADVPTVLVLHALTGHAAAGGEGGWWAPVIGEGQPLDPTRHRLLSVALLGGCYGSSGPVDTSFPRDGSEPAVVTTWDQARAVLLVLDRLGIRHIELLTGGSLGAMVAVCLAALAPDRIRRMAVFGGCTTASPWIVGFNHVGGAVIRALRDAADPGRGLELARQMAMLTYRAEAGLEDRQSRNSQTWSALAPYPVEGWLEHHGRALRARFEADAYLCLIGAMSHHDLARNPGAPDGSESWTAFTTAPEERIRASTVAVGINSDHLYLPIHMTMFADRLRRRGVAAEAPLLESRHGHDAFLIEWTQVRAFLARSWELPPAA